MRRFLPKRAEPVAFSLMLSGMMSLMVSGLSTALVGAPTVRRVLKSVVSDK